MDPRVHSTFRWQCFYWLWHIDPDIARIHHGTESQIGLVTGIFTLSAILVRPLAGGMIDRYSFEFFLFLRIPLAHTERSIKAASPEIEETQNSTR